MSEPELKLRDLFKVDPAQLSSTAELGLGAYKTVDHIRQEIKSQSRAIRWPWVQSLIAQRTASLLDLDVLDLLLDAWKKFDEVEKCADQQQSNHDPALVPLVEHTLKSKHHPYIEVLIQDRPVDRITFDLEFELTLNAFALEMQDGRILEVQTGSAEGEVSLSLAGVDLLKYKPQPLHFPGSIPLRNRSPIRAKMSA
jgi:hypothetical protein